jgi:hypothetical protein
MRALVALGALEVLVLAGLAGSAHPVETHPETRSCGSDPAVAATVADVAITEAEVGAAVADVRESLEAVIAENLPDASEAERAQELAIREDAEHHAVIERRILTEATLAYAASHGLPLPQPDVAGTAAAYELSTASDYVRVIAEYQAAMAGLEGAVVATAIPTEADQREVYDNVVAQGLTEVAFEQAQPMLTPELLGGPVAQRNLIAVVIGEADICVNPRYQLAHRVPVPIAGEQSWLSIPIGEAG